MKKINNVVNSLWISPVMGDLQILCLRSFLDKKIDFHLYTYNSISNLPAGVIIKDANEIIDASRIFKDIKNSYATYSDWFRIKLLHEIGGWWVDCDTFCVKKFDIDAPYIFATESSIQNNERHFKICNAVIKMPSKSVFGDKVLAKIHSKLQSRNYIDIKWTELGAEILDEIIVEENLTKYIVRPEVFCPNDYQNYKQLALKKSVPFDKITFGVHLWNQMWEQSNLKPLEMASEISFIAKAMKEISNK